VQNDDFREALGRWASGVTVVATENQGRRAGLTASSFTSVSLDPPLILVCIDRRAESCEARRLAPHFAVSILATGQEPTALQMARPGPDKFAGLAFSPGSLHGQPLVDGALVHLECRNHRVDEGGDHLILLGEVLAARTFDASPLVYFYRRFRPLA